MNNTVIDLLILKITNELRQWWLLLKNPVSFYFKKHL